MPNNPHEFTPQEKQFVDYVKSGMKQTDAARKCGYENPRTDSIALMCKPHIHSKLMKHVQLIHRSWKELKENSKGVLFDVLKGAKDATWAHRIKCAEIVLNTLQKFDGASLADSAAAEDDRDANIAELARRVVGRPTDAPNPNEETSN